MAMAHTYKAIRNPDIYGLVNQLNTMAADGWEAISVLHAAGDAEQPEAKSGSAERPGRSMFVAVVRKPIAEGA